MSRGLTPVGIGFTLVALFTSGDSQAQGKETNLGTWKVNVEKSKYSPGPAPKSSQTRTYQDRGDGMYSINIVGVNAQGNPTRQMMVFKYDGKEYPLAQLNATNIVTVANRRIDPYTTEVTFRTNGKITTTAIETISKDGKTMTFEQKGTNAQGQAIHNVIILEKQ